MVYALFNLKSQIFPPFRTSFWLSWIRVRIPNKDPDPGELFQYGSTWIPIGIQDTASYPTVYLSSKYIFEENELPEQRVPEGSYILVR